MADPQLEESDKLAPCRPLTENERFWVEIIRLASWDSDPPPTLERVQALRGIFGLR